MTHADPIEVQLQRIDAALTRNAERLADYEATTAKTRPAMTFADARAAGIWAPATPTPDARALEAERDDLRIQRDQARADRAEALGEITAAWAALNAAGLSHPTASVAEVIAQLAEERDVARHLVELRTAALERRTAERDGARRIADILRDDIAAPTAARRQTAAERPDSAGEGTDKGDGVTEAHRGAQRAHEPNCHADPRAHWTDCECWCHDAIGERDHCENLADLMERAKTVRIDRDGDFWRPTTGGRWTFERIGPLTLDALEAHYGPTRLVLLIDIEQDDEQDETDVAPPPGSAGDRAQGSADALAPWIRRAVGNPGSIAGRRRGPTWPEGSEGWAEEQETIAAWTTRAVLAVIAHGGRPVCERCDEVIQVDDAYDPPLPGIGLWEHHGQCPGEPNPADLAEHRPTVARILADVRAGRSATSPTLGEYHWGRAWGPTQDEATCPCPKARCGYVVRTAEPAGCEHHGPTTTMRGGHTADQCPATTREG